MIRDIVNGNAAYLAPAVFNPLCARLAEQAGFKVLYLGGGPLGYVKTVLEANLGLTEMVQAGVEIRAACGLPLILGGDWNDGMNRVGAAGKGTSTWLGWFLAGTLRGFLPYARERKDQARVTRWESHLETLKKALDTAMAGHVPEGAQLQPWRLHDLRRTAATGMGENDVDPHVIERVLNHISGTFAGVVGVYNRAKMEGKKRDALEVWAKHVAKVVS